MSTGIFVDGDKNGFNSKTAFQKFKDMAKKDDNLDNLKKFVKSDYELKLVSKNDKEIRFTLMPKPKEKDQTLERLRKMLKSQLKVRAHVRANKKMPEKTEKDDPMDNILFEYTRLKKMINAPVPSPKEIFENPHKYKQLIDMVVSNNTLKSADPNNPYIRYFTLLSETLNLSTNTSQKLNTSPNNKMESEPVPELVTNNDIGNTIANDVVTTTNTFENVLNSTVNSAITDVKGTVNENDTDTEEEK
jgi:hypothetical protein